jgi:hypothetical protein
LSKSAEARPIRLALNIEDRALADRIAALLANVPDLRLVSPSESSADIIDRCAAQTCDGEQFAPPTISFGNQTLCRGLKQILNVRLRHVARR